MIDKKQVHNVEHFSYLGRVITIDARCTRDIKYRIATAKEEESFHQQIALEFKNELSNATSGGGLGMLLKVGHFGNYTRNAWEVFKCGAREEWKRTFGPIA